MKVCGACEHAPYRALFGDGAGGATDDRAYRAGNHCSGNAAGCGPFAHRIAAGGKHDKA